MSLLTFITTLRMRDDHIDDSEYDVVEQGGASTKTIWLQTIDAGRWILRTPIALVIICAGFLFDSIIRMVITLNSQYYRVIEIPEAVFGLIGAGVAGLGLFLPRIALKMSEKYTPRFNLMVLAVMTIIGLYGMSLFMPVAGLVPAVVLFSAMYMTGFFVSNYLNRMTSSHRRATVLSFKGLSFNLSYGLLGILYSVLLAGTRPKIAATYPDADSLILENMVFMGSFKWFLWAFLGGLAVFTVFSALKLRSVNDHTQLTVSTEKTNGNP
jgi:hypothetical protein